MYVRICLCESVPSIDSFIRLIARTHTHMRACNHAMGVCMLTQIHVHACVLGWEFRCLASSRISLQARACRATRRALGKAHRGWEG